MKLVPQAFLRAGVWAWQSAIEGTIPEGLNRPKVTTNTRDMLPFAWSDTSLSLAHLISLSLSLSPFDSLTPSLPPRHSHLSPILIPIDWYSDAYPSASRLIPLKSTTPK